MILPDMQEVSASCSLITFELSFCILVSYEDGLLERHPVEKNGVEVRARTIVTVFAIYGLRLSALALVFVSHHNLRT